MFYSTGPANPEFLFLDTLATAIVFESILSWKDSIYDFHKRISPKLYILGNYFLLSLTKYFQQ